MFMLQNFSKTEGEAKEEGNAEKLVDPVHWYGLFAPQALKDAQSRFVKGNQFVGLANGSVGGEC